jgi:hypothetical protein
VSGAAGALVLGSRGEAPGAPFLALEPTYSNKHGFSHLHGIDPGRWSGTGLAERLFAEPQGPVRGPVLGGAWGRRRSGAFASITWKVLRRTQVVTVAAAVSVGAPKRCGRLACSSDGLVPGRRGPCRRQVEKLTTCSDPAPSGRTAQHSSEPAPVPHRLSPCPGWPVPYDAGHGCRSRVLHRSRAPPDSLPLAAFLWHG